jgi:hypothetical protein
VLGATPAASGSAGTLFQLGQRVNALFVNGFDDGAFADADTPADHFVVGHLRDIETSVFRRVGEEKLAPQRRKVFLCAQPLHVAVAVGSIADENRAGEFAVAKAQFFVDAQSRIFITDNVRARRFFGKIARGKDGLHP